MHEVGNVYKMKGREDGKHFHIIIIGNKQVHPTVCIAVYLTSTEMFVDHTCEFTDGEDDFISEACWVKYKNARILPTMDLDKTDYVGVAKPGTMRRIIDGFEESITGKRIQKEVVDLYRQWKQDNLFDNL